jgi:hypothetical protein
LAVGRITGLFIELAQSAHFGRRPGAGRLIEVDLVGYAAVSINGHIGVKLAAPDLQVHAKVWIIVGDVAIVYDHQSPGWPPDGVERYQGSTDRAARVNLKTYVHLSSSNFGRI